VYRRLRWTYSLLTLCHLQRFFHVKPLFNLLVFRPILRKELLRLNENKISILSRGKVALEDVLDLYRDGGLYTKYLIGEIRADFLDINIF
jgi:hypothetical protein